MLLPVLLVLSFLLGVVSLGTTWWSYSANGGGGSFSIGFLPGGNYDVSCSHCAGFSSGSFPYSAIGGSVGGIYEAVLGLMIATVVLTGLATGIAVLGWLGRRTGWWQRSGSFVLIVLSFVFTIAAVAGTVAAQPGSFASNTSFDGLGGTGASPASSFWGSNGAASWGAGAGWYLAAVMTGLLVVVCAVLILAGHERLAVPERRSRTATAQPVARTYAAPDPAEVAPPRAYTAPPPTTTFARPTVSRPPIASYSGTRVTPRPVPASKTTAGDAPPDAPVSKAPPPPKVAAAPAPAMVECPECGTPNLAKSRTCSYCQRSLRN